MTIRVFMAVLAALLVFAAIGAVIAIVATQGDDSRTTTTVVETSR